MQNAKMRLILLLVLIMLAVTLVEVSERATGTPQVEIDCSCRVSKVIDGDTVRCVILEVYSRGLSLEEGKEYKVRLADVNAPELRPEPEPGSIEATERLRDLVEGRVVYLDVDDVNVVDRYGRLVAILLVPYNSTHLVNVNKLLIQEGHAKIWEHNNEWLINMTLLYIPWPSMDSEPPNSRDKGVILNPILAALASIIIILAAIVAAKKMFIRET